MPTHNTDFFSRVAKIFNSEQSRSVILCGNVYDLFFDGEGYVPLIPFLCSKSETRRIIRVVYELNGPIRVLDDREKLKQAWISWRAGVDPDTLRIREMRQRGPSEVDRLASDFERNMLDAIGNPTLALEMLRQLTICSRNSSLREDLLVIVEAADMMLPAGSGDVASLNDRQLHRIGIVHDWFGDPGFLGGGDSVCLVAESRSLIHPRISRLPQVLSVEIPAPTKDDRSEFVQHFCRTAKTRPELWGEPEDLAVLSAGLSLHALRQLLLASAHGGQPLEPAHVVDKVEAFIRGQIGEDVVEFKKPGHTLDDVVGFQQLKDFLRRELMPRFRASPDRALPGAAVAGPIGSGKTFIFEAVAAELEMPVLVLKNIRSQWFGQTDVIFERLRRVLTALEKVVIFVDEADTQFGGVGAESHPTERRLTGKIQAMMSDPQLRGKVIWLLMTARIQLLSPDIRRPGRVGDLIIPVFDPAGDDRRDFVRWVLSSVMPNTPDDAVERLDALTEGYSAAAFASLRSHLKATQPGTVDAIAETVADLIPPAIGLTRRYQTLQALVNCTRRSLLPKPDEDASNRETWQQEIRQLEAQGIR